MSAPLTTKSPALTTLPRHQAATRRVIVGMSGGVDSSVAAYLLQQANFQVAGLFMKNWEEDDGTEYCTAKEDLADAQRVCEKLGIQLYTANFAAEYWDNVFASFLHEYRANYTPNPDVLCNREIKFKQFADYATRLGADYIATGHYARIAHHKSGPMLHKAKDQNKDQTYFLQAVPSEQLERALFPLGEWLKDDVRTLAAQLGLHNHARKDSTGICFIGERRFADFLHRYIEDAPGEIIDLSGRTLGQHRGLHQFTCGQRQGLQLGGIKGRAEAPWYVVGKLPGHKQLVVSQDDRALNATWLRAEQPNWLAPVTLPQRCYAKIRYRQADQACTVSAAADGGLLIRFDTPQRAVTPGQYIALYQYLDTEGLHTEGMGTEGIDTENIDTHHTLIGGARIQATDTSQLTPLRSGLHRKNPR